jgi:hypothetical protein
LLAGLVSHLPENRLFRKELLRVGRLAHPNQPARAKLPLAFQRAARQALPEPGEVSGSAAKIGR